MRKTINLSAMTIAAVQEMLKEAAPTAELAHALRADSRQGLQRLAQQVERQLEQQAVLKRRYQAMLAFERQYWNQGIQFVAGVDEAGRGPLAGPVVASAAILSPDFYLLGLNDSKQLTGEEREEYYPQIEEQAVAVGIGVVDHSEIDEINILQATFKAMTLALRQIQQAEFVLEIVLVDGDKTIPAFSSPQVAIVEGDARSISIAAASVIAKVTRDRMMTEYAKEYPGYGFERNKGYSAPEHLEGLRKLGPSPIHRKTFSLVRQSTYSAVYQQLAQEIFTADSVGRLQDIGMIISQKKESLPDHEFAELLQLYNKVWHKRSTNVKAGRDQDRQAIKMF